MPAMFAANLLALAMAANASTAPASEDAVAATDNSWVEYQLAAAAQPGDALSDFVLARGLAFQQDLPSTYGTIPDALRQHMAAEHERLMANADAALMDDPVQLSLRLDCRDNAPEREHCDVRRVRLAELDPDNAYAAMALMAAAWNLKDDAGFAEAAALGARAARYEPAFPAVFASLNRRYGSVPDVAVPGMPRSQDDSPVAGVTAMSVAAAVALPAYQWFSQPCRNSEGELRAHCLAIARRMVDGEALAIDVLIGVGVLQAIGDEADREAATERKRQIDWLLYHALAAETGPDHPAAAERERYFETYGERGEIPAMREFLQARGIALEPPKDWTGSPTGP